MKTSLQSPLRLVFRTLIRWQWLHLNQNFRKIVKTASAATETILKRKLKTQLLHRISRPNIFLLLKALPSKR